jgi:hypothetical protein
MTELHHITTDHQGFELRALSIDMFDIFGVKRDRLVQNQDLEGWERGHDNVLSETTSASSSGTAPFIVKVILPSIEAYERR